MGAASTWPRRLPCRVEQHPWAVLASFCVVLLTVTLALLTPFWVALAPPWVRSGSVSQVMWWFAPPVLAYLCVFLAVRAKIDYGATGKTLSLFVTSGIVATLAALVVTVPLGLVVGFFGVLLLSQADLGFALPFAVSGALQGLALAWVERRVFGARAPAGLYGRSAVTVAVGSLALFWSPQALDLGHHAPWSIAVMCALAVLPHLALTPTVQPAP